MGAEGDHLSAADAPPVLVSSPFGTIGSYACMDGIVPEVPRSIVAGGARLLLNSLNSFALDEAALHIPVRAAENRAWLVACCKVGPLLPPEKTSMFSEMMGVPADMLDGAGESQIVAPDGTVVAQAPRRGEAVVAADIDLDRGGQARPDGTDPWLVRRPSLYGPLAAPTPMLDEHRRAEALEVAATDEAAQVPALARSGAQLIVLPELAVGMSDLDAISSALEGTDSLVVTSVRDGDAHVGVAVGADGVVSRQVQLHDVARHAWATQLGDELVTVDLDWGRLAIVVGDDLIHPEVARLAALRSADVIAVPTAVQELWESDLCAIERAAENRVCVVMATPRDSPGTSLVADLPPDFTLWATSRERPFDGTINTPDVHRPDAGDERDGGGSGPSGPGGAPSDLQGHEPGRRPPLAHLRCTSQLTTGRPDPRTESVDQGRAGVSDRRRVGHGRLAAVRVNLGTAVRATARAAISAATSGILVIEAVVGLLACEEVAADRDGHHDDGDDRQEHTRAAALVVTRSEVLGVHLDLGRGGRLFGRGGRLGRRGRSRGRSRCRGGSSGRRCSRRGGGGGSLPKLIAWLA